MFNIPRIPLWLTLVGLIPFLVSAGAILILRDYPIRVAQFGLVLLVYSAVIVSFLGGVRWGIEIAAPNFTPVEPRKMVLSVLGSLAGWGFVLWAVLQSLSPTLYLVAALAITLHWAWDMVPDESVPRWYKGLRTIATAGALGALATAYITTAFLV